MIKIGVSACFVYPDSKRAFFAQKTLCSLENDMANYLYREDVMPILIPPLKEKSFQYLLTQMEGFVLQGGSDICPHTYGETFLNKERWPGDEYRDHYELKIVDHAFKYGKPILGICRGAQLVNVYFGGTLYQDLPTQFGSALLHRDDTVYDRFNHPIEFVSGKILSGLYGNVKNPAVCSVHHQGVKQLGNDLVVEAFSPQDKLIEAFSYKNMQQILILGVQWHPEYSPTVQAKLIRGEPIYDYFLQYIRTREMQNENL